jgi:hypothetical protein
MSMTTSEQRIKKFSENLYKKLINNFNQPESPFWLLTRDDATFSELPGITSANIRNVLIGGHSSGTATYEELIIARAYYEASCVELSFSMLSDDPLMQRANSPTISFTNSQTMDIEMAVDHLLKSTAIIISRIWSKDTINNYLLRKQSAEDNTRNLSKQAIRALFGCSRRQKVSLYQLNMPIHRRIALLNECINVCNISTNDGDSRFATIDDTVARRAYNRIVVDPCGMHRVHDLKLQEETQKFPLALKEAIACHGYIDDWAVKVQFNPTLPRIIPTCSNKHKKQKKNIDLNHQEGEKNGPTVSIKNITYSDDNDTNQSFWFVTINEAFSDSFWNQWTSAIDNMRFCVGLGGKQNAFVRCSSQEPGAIFTTGGRFTYHVLPLSEMEQKILNLSRFVMGFQRAYIERLYGSDFQVTWDANLLHHVVAPIIDAVYSAHNDYSPLLCSMNEDHNTHVFDDVYLPTRNNMQVLTIYCSNYRSAHNDSCCATMTYSYNNKKLDSAKLGSRGIHIQGPGSQSMGVKHQVSIDPDAHRAGIYRCICTTRLSVVPKNGKSFDDSVLLEGAISKKQNVRLDQCHNQLMVITRLSNNQLQTTSTAKETIIVRNASSVNCSFPVKRKSTIPSIKPLETAIDDSGSESTARESIVWESIAADPTILPIPTKINTNISGTESIVGDPTIEQIHTTTITKTIPPGKILYAELYPKLPKAWFDTYNIRFPQPKMAFDDKVRTLTSGNALLCFLRRGYLVYVKRADGKLYPCLYEITNSGNRHGLLNYGHRYPSSAVCADARLRHKDRMHAPIQTSELRQNIIVLTHRYKQIPARIDSLVDALDRYNDQQTHDNGSLMGIDFGKFDGHITILGSGGSNAIQGKYAPTTKCRKDDPLIKVRLGQNRYSPINKKLESLVSNNSVQAIFLNEKYYYGKEQLRGDHPNLLRFLGYYQLSESRYACGVSKKDLDMEFNNPTRLEWENLTFRLHQHLRIEATPFIPKLEDVDQLLNKSSTSYTKIVIDHNDHSPILYTIPLNKDWRTANHEISIEDVIADMIDSGEIIKYLAKESCTSSLSDSLPFNEEVDSCDNDNQYNLGLEYESNVDFDEINNFHDLDDEEYINDDIHNSEDEDNDDILDIEDEDNIKDDKMHDEIYENKNRCTVEGTSISVPDLVYGCLYISAACAMRYNKKGLCHDKGTTYVAPLKELQLGTCLRVKPIPSPNRTLDVVLCYLRSAFEDHAEILPSILAKKRCHISDISLQTLSDMLFQIILLRFTGRIYCFEQYHEWNSAIAFGEERCSRRIPFREDCPHFLEFVRVHMMQHKTTTLEAWVSKQHDGQIAADLKKNYEQFGTFLKTVSTIIEETVNTMRRTVASNPDAKGNRLRCTAILQKMIERAMESSAVHNYGGVKWMAYISVCDLEEFVLEPFGPIDSSMIPIGVYSQRGHEMVKRGSNNSLTYQNCLDQIVSYVHHKISDKHLQVLGYERNGDDILNVVNARLFSAVDAEHFLCKAWIITKLTFGSSNLSDYPHLCSAHTHPSPVLHAIDNAMIGQAMVSIEDAFYSCNSNSTHALKLPECCKLYEE